MTNALNSGNQNGQTTDNVGQDGNGETQENSTNWEEQAKYFQGEKDKLSVENDRLKNYEEIGKFLESRPDVVKVIEDKVGGQPTEAPIVKLSPEEFDPWEAYNDPSSKSYQFRTQEMTQAINGAVSQAVGKQSAQMNAKQGIANLTSELRNRGYNDDQIKGFINFTSRNPADYGLDTVLKMYETVNGGDTNVIPNSGLDNVRNIQNQPTPGGILDGQQPKVKNQDNDMWKDVLGASRVGNKIP